MRFELDQIDIRDNGIWISRAELERKYKDLREKGYANDRLWREGCTPCHLESIVCHAKADILWDLITYIDNEQ